MGVTTGQEILGGFGGFREIEGEIAPSMASLGKKTLKKQPDREQTAKRCPDLPPQNSR